jgi:replicative DNA helicase
MEHDADVLDNLIDDRLDPEAQLLCALLWSPKGSADVAFVVEHLRETDFYNRMYAHIFACIAAAVRDDSPHDASSINVRLAAEGGEIVPQYQRLLISLVGLGSPAGNLIYYGDQLLSTWYRRQFSDMTQSLAQIAEIAPEHELFTRMVEHGIAQRKAMYRRKEFLNKAIQARKAQEDE